MNHKDGERAGQVLLDAISYAQERIEDGKLLGMAIVMSIEDSEGVVHITAHTWPRKD